MPGDGPHDARTESAKGGSDDVASDDVARDAIASDDVANDTAGDGHSVDGASETRADGGGETATNDGGADETSRRGCASWQPFGMPVPVPGIVDVDDDFVSMRLSPDESIAYVSAARSGQFDILISSRATRLDSFQPGTPLSALNSPFEDSWPSVTGDGLTLYMNSTRAGAFQLFVSRRAFVAAEFSPPSELVTLDVAGEGGPYVTPDGSALYFHSWRGFGNADLYRAARNGSGFSEPDRLAVINTGANELYPVVTPDELTIYYVTDNEPTGRNGIWMATRVSVTESFANAVFLPELNGPLDAVPNWISPDGCRLYYGARDTALRYWPYVAERNP